MFGFLRDLDVEVYVAEVASARAASVEAIAAAVGRTVGAHGTAAQLFDDAPDRGYTAVFGSIYLLGEWFVWAGIDASQLVTWDGASL